MSCRAWPSWLTPCARTALTRTAVAYTTAVNVCKRRQHHRAKKLLTRWSSGLNVSPVPAPACPCLTSFPPLVPSDGPASRMKLVRARCASTVPPKLHRTDRSAHPSHFSSTRHAPLVALARECTSASDTSMYTPLGRFGGQNLLCPCVTPETRSRSRLFVSSRVCIALFAPSLVLRTLVQHVAFVCTPFRDVARQSHF